MEPRQCLPEELPGGQREARRRRIPPTGYYSVISWCASRAGAGLKLNRPGPPSRGAPTPRQSHTTRAGVRPDQALTHQYGSGNRTPRSPSLHPLQMAEGGTDPPGRRRTCESAPPAQRGPAVQAARIHLVHVQRGCGIGRIDAVHAVHQCPVTHTTQQAVRNTRRAAGTTGNLRETLGGICISIRPALRRSTSSSSSTE